ncbi:MAG TPA: lamin tail domain-containing protein [Tepidisphaeraceae bacterium]|jgi:hypothetical protein
MLGKVLTLSALALASASAPAYAAITITEVHPSGSDSTYGADWFELTNTGPADVNVTGWKFDDSSASTVSGVFFRGITTIPAQTRVVFLNGNTAGDTDAAIRSAFETAWFGTSVPAGLLIAAYGGSGTGLSQAGDAVNIYDANGALVTSVDYVNATLGVTFDNTAGASGTISTLSVAGTNDAFRSANDLETGSPGTAVPEPTTLAALGILGLTALRRRTR